MTDEKYLFLSDSREKKNIANSARSKRGHCGRGGWMKTPSDFKTKKELEKLNGDVKAYKLNDPMKWNEFKSMPEDLQISYIKLLRSKFEVPNKYIANMFGVHIITFNKQMQKLGITTTRKGRDTKWDKDGFYAWISGVKAEEVPTVTEESEQLVAQSFVESVESAIEPAPVKRILPKFGTMNLVGITEDVLDTIRVLLGGGKCVRGICMAHCGGGHG